MARVIGLIISPEKNQHLRKPDVDIFKMAIDISQTNPENILYIDDRHMFVEVAQSLHMHGIHFENLEKTQTYLKLYGFATIKVQS